LADLPKGAVVGTSSLRRKAQLKRLRPDLKIKDLRGNVDTRLRKLEAGEYDGIILAYAGLRRLGFENKVKEKFSPNQFIPAVAQGFLGIETRLDDEKTNKIVSVLNDKNSYIRATAERAFLKRLEGGCQVPLGAYAEIKEGKLSIIGFISDVEGKEFISGELTGDLDNPEEFGIKLAEELLNKGGKEILEKIYSEG
jgi:hydroxymethylbilane synthase